MAFLTKQEYHELWKKRVIENEPYPLEVLNVLDCDEKYIGDKRYASTIALQALLDDGYTEEEVNPWKKRAS